MAIDRKITSRWCILHSKTFFVLPVFLMSPVIKLCEDRTYNNLRSPQDWSHRKEIHFLLSCNESHHWQFLSFYVMAFLHSFGCRNFFTETLMDQDLLTDTIDREINVQQIDEIWGQKVTQRPSARQVVAYKRKKHGFRYGFFRWLLDLGSNQGPTD